MPCQYPPSQGLPDALAACQGEARDPAKRQLKRREPLRAAIFNGPRNITPGERPDAAIKEPPEGVVRVVGACVCGSDLWYYRGDSPFEPGPIGHEFIGVIEDIGADVSALAEGDLMMPFWQLGHVPLSGVLRRQAARRRADHRALASR